MRTSLISLTLLTGAVASNSVETLSTIAHNINSAQTSWTASDYEASRGLTLDDFRAMLGSPVPKKRVASGRPAGAAAPPKPPATFDSRAQWPQCPTIGSIQDQGACGSCWAVAAAEAFSDRACIGSNGTFSAQLSALKLLACDAACGPVGCDSGCQGGFPGDAWKYMVGTGLPTKDCVPYTIAPCHHPCGDNTTTPACPADACSNGGAYQVVQASTSYPFFSEKDVMADIVKNGPVECGMSVYTDFPAYKSGIYKHTTGTLLGGHAVKIIGWGVDNATNTPYWEVVSLPTHASGARAPHALAFILPTPSPLLYSFGRRIRGTRGGARTASSASSAAMGRSPAIS